MGMYKWMYIYWDVQCNITNILRGKGEDVTTDRLARITR
jgi:hypothetical protein